MGIVNHKRMCSMPGRLSDRTVGTMLVYAARLSNWKSVLFLEPALQPTADQKRRRLWERDCVTRDIMKHAH